MYRAATLAFRSHVLGTQPPADKVTEALLRGVVSPATVVGKAPLASTAVVDAIVGLAGQSAAASLIRMSPTNVVLIGHASVKIPVRVVTASDGSAWVGEGMPIPAARLEVPGRN